MNVLETEWWSVALPPEWWAEQEEGGVLIGDRDGVGCIEVSTLQREQGEFEEGEVRAIAEGQAEPGQSWTPVSAGDFSGVSASLLEEGTALTEWYLACGPLLLYVTYSCPEEHRGLDDAAVKEILDTLAAAS